MLNKLSACILLWGLSVGGFAQSMVMVKTYDKDMKALPDLELSLDGGSHYTTNQDGSLYLELDESKLPPKSISINNPQLEAESWNYSKGVLEVIVRKRSYRLTTIQLIDRFGKKQPGLELHLNTTEAIHKTSDQNGSLQIPIPLTLDVTSTNLLEVPGFTIRERKVQRGLVSLVIDPILVAEPIKRSTSPQTFDSDQLDSIQSLTVFYGFIKNLDIQKLSAELRSRIDQKFYSLLSLQNDTLGLEAFNPIGKISDSSLVGEDISLLIEQARQEERNLSELKLEFDEKIALISSKLVGGGANLDAKTRQELLQKIEQLDEILTANSRYFSSTRSDYHDILNSLRNRLLNIKDLEKRLTDVQQQRSLEQQKFRKRLLIISLVVLGLALISFVLLMLLKKINRQKKEIDLAHQELNEVNEHLEDLVVKRTKLLKVANEELDTFMYRSSHDLRRPLTSLLGLVEVARMTLKKESLDLFERVASTAQSMDHMLQKLIMVSHINQPTETALISLEDLIPQYNGEFQGWVNKYGIDLDWIIEPGLTHETSPVMLNIILRNLLENSLRFSVVGNSQIKPRVLINMHRSDNLLVVQVEDNAGGIAPEVQPKIWNMFYVGNEASKGNGLGLYVTRRAVERLGAEISFECTGQKTVFTVKIPASNIRRMKVPEMVAV